MRTKFKFILLLATLFFSYFAVIEGIFTKVAASSEYDWEMVRDEDGIQVYLKNFWADDVKSFRGVIHINSSLDSLLAVILDIDACTDWVHRCKKSLLLARVSFAECYHYQIHKLPFPAANREFIFHSKVTRSPKTGSVNIRMRAVPGYCQDKTHQCKSIPESSLIRVKHSHGHYLLEAISQKNTRVTWTNHTNPEGNLPIWLINSLVEEMPFRTLQGLRKKVFHHPYQKARLIINHDGQITALENSR